MSLIHVTWVTSGQHTIGIGVTENTEGVRKIRAAVVAGQNMAVDEHKVANNGGTIGIQELENILYCAKAGRQ